jgi:serine phosphatase RsbU (regulator of sigma subunit)
MRIEAANAADDLFGLERVKSGLANAANRAPDATADVLIATMNAWSGQPPSDDLTIVLLDWQPEGSLRSSERLQEDVADHQV